MQADRLVCDRYLRHTISMEQESATEGRDSGREVWPHFPPEGEEVWQDTQEFQRLSPTERFLAIMELIAFGEAMLKASPQRAFAEQHCQLQEENWQQIHKELFAHHGR